MENKRSRRQSAAVTVHDVALHAGVSAMTVSRVVNGERNVRDVTRARVEAAISALSYAPNPAAQSLAGADRVRIGLLYSNPSAAYLSEFLVGGLEGVSRSNVGLVVEKCEPGSDEIAAAERLIADRVDGIVLPPPLCDSQALIALLAERDLPAVAVASGRPAPGLAAVGIDFRAAARDMTRHLLALGHVRIGFIIGHPNQTVSAERLEGYREALAEAGIAHDSRLETPGLFSYRSGLDATERLLALEPKPTAIFASNDDMAAAAIAVAHRHRLDLPRELTVVGFDDTAPAITVWPELTTVRQPIAAMSREAVGLLVDMIRRKRAGDTVEGETILLGYEIIHRESDAPPA